MRLATREQSQTIDRLAQTNFGLTSEHLMDTAGFKAAKEILDFPNIGHKNVVIVCGTGNNGGDGYVVEKYLKKQKVLAKALSAKDVRASDLEDADIIVDAIFGTGLNRALNEISVALINLINLSSAYVVSLDVPSGLNCDTGWDFGACIRSDLTITFGLAKPGFFINLGPSRVGQICICDIGFPKELIENIATTHSVILNSEARELLPLRHELSNKSDFGRTAVVAGQKGMWGAAVLSSRAAFRSGSGYVYLLSFDDPSHIVNMTPETMSLKIKNSIVEFGQMDKISSWVVGPGLGVSEQTFGVIKELMQLNVKSVLLDADALTSLAKFGYATQLPSSWVLTPHTGEMSRLINQTVEEIEYDRCKALKSFYDLYGCQILLKGFHSIHFDGQHFSIINSGNVALAKAGAGDVLSGIIGGLMAQGLSSSAATQLGTFVHGFAADLWVEDNNYEASLLTSELLEWIPKAFKELKTTHEPKE